MGKHILTLSEHALKDQTDTLESLNIPLPVTKDANSFAYMLEVCLLVERNRRQEQPQEDLSELDLKSESQGDYNCEALQGEDISRGTRHAAYLGPVAQAALPSPKNQGVVTTRDVAKGELLCTSVPTIIVECLAPSCAHESAIFADMSRAQMTAKLISLVESSQECLHELNKLDFAGKDLFGDQIEVMCEAVICKYTWAIDHPSNNPEGRSLRGMKTKVAGHAFSLHGYAGKFNHSCVPNATMVNYGAVQFFLANCSITKGTEICVSYGFDPLHTVQMRQKKLFQHAEFMCDCPLCVFQLARPVKDRIRKRKLVGETLDDQTFVRDMKRMIEAEESRTGPLDIPDHAISLEWITTALHETAQVMEGVPSPIIPWDEKVNILAVLSLYPRLLDVVEVQRDKIKDALVLQRLRMLLMLLYIMFLALELPRRQDIGIVFGDLFRLRIQELVGLLNSEAWREMLDIELHGADQFLHGEWWEAKALEYTACF